MAADSSLQRPARRRFDEQNIGIVDVQGACFISAFCVKVFDFRVALIAPGPPRTARANTRVGSSNNPDLGREFETSFSLR